MLTRMPDRGHGSLNASLPNLALLVTLTMGEILYPIAGFR